jgi:hypothetical protein
MAMTKAPSCREEAARLDAEVAHARRALEGYRRAADAAFTERVVAAARELKPKAKKMSPTRAGKVLGDAYQPLKDELVARWASGYAARKMAVDDAVEARRAHLASLEPIAGDEWFGLDETWESTYRTQGWGAKTYAKGAAEHRAMGYHNGSPGIEIRVREEPKEYSTDYHIEAAVACELEADIVKARFDPPSMRELVKMSWAAGLNPRVIYPSIPHGFEEEEGIDWQGRDKKPA